MLAIILQWDKLWQQLDEQLAFSKSCTESGHISVSEYASSDLFLATYEQIKDPQMPHILTLKSQLL